jgi:hypothetical protein
MNIQGAAFQVLKEAGKPLVFVPEDELAKQPDVVIKDPTD